MKFGENRVQRRVAVLFGERRDKALCNRCRYLKLVAGTTAATAATASARKFAGGFGRGAVAGAVGSRKNGKLNRGSLAGALRASNLLLFIEHNLLEMRLAILTNVFVDGHRCSLNNFKQHYTKSKGWNQAIISTIMQSKSIAKTVSAASIRVPCRPSIASRIMKGEPRTTTLVNDRHLATEDQSPKSTLQGIVKNATTHVMRRAEIESSAAQPSIAHHLGSG